MAATASEAIMIELEKEGWEWIRSERYHQKQKQQQKEREKNNPMKLCVLKYDHFENIHRLPKEIPAFEGAPNFRQVPGYLVFGTGQPTKEGFKTALDHIFTDTEAKKVLWTNMRQEPVVYMNGQSFTPRLADKMNENMEFPGVSGDDIEWLQDQFVKVIFERLEEDKKKKEKDSVPKKGVQFKVGNMVKYYRDTYAEHPEDRENIEYQVPLDNEDALVTLAGMYEQIKEFGFNLCYARLPIVDEKAPREIDFDTMVAELKDEPLDTACIFNCQMGKGRTTTGMVLACLLKDVIYNKDKTFPKVPEVNPKDFADEDEYAEERARLGQFKVLDNIFKYIPEAREAKDHLDHVLDLCGPPPLGQGLQNLRECILWTQTKHSFEPKKKKPFWKQMSLNFIERYCFLLCFTTYIKAEVSRGFEKSFSLWMDERAEIREVIHNGVKNFNWE